MADQNQTRTMTRPQAPDVLDPGASEASIGAVLTLAGDSEVDMQVATAKKYPRSVVTFLRRAQELAGLNVEVARSCIYAVPRDGKIIEGPSARFAELMASAYGNLRAKGYNAGEDEHFTTGAAVAWDIENNVAIGFEVKRRITGKSGRRYNEDMISVTSNAAASIALRNAILKMIPSPLWRPIYDHCRKVIAGDQKTFASRRDEMFKAFAVMGATEQRVCAALGSNIKGKADVTLEHIVTLSGFYTALKEGDADLDTVFPEVTAAAPRTPAPEPATTNEPKPPADTAAPAPSSTSTAPAPAPPAPAAASQPAAGAVPALQPGEETVVARVISLTPKGDRLAVGLSSSHILHTVDPEVKRAAEAAKAVDADFLFVFKRGTPGKTADKLTGVRNPA